MLKMAHRRMVVFKLKDYEQFGGFEHMPKGELLRFAVNPYNGNVVLQYQDWHENACEIIEHVMNQILRDLRLMRMKESDADLNMLADYLEGVIDMDISPQVVRIERRKVHKARKAV